MNSKIDTLSAPTFLSDHASAEDFFGSHQRVADAIVSVIDTSQQTKVIGILGPWGSGKSTIVRLVEGGLSKQPTEGKHTFFFSYDAWLHQNDPPRRSFLESLIRFLVSQNVTTADKWKDDLDRLNRRVEDNDITTTPTLTLPGKLIAASLLLTAYGWKLADSSQSFSLLGCDFSVAKFGYALISAPVWGGLIAYVWLKINRDESHETVFSMFVNKAIERVKTKTIRTPDPTAIEFQEVFRRIMASVGRSNRSFVFVIDNLDRISESDAIAIWSTIRSFFVDELRGSVDEVANVASPTVLLPLDPKAIQRIYGKAEAEAEELAQSFIDKTFNLVFRVSPPVQSGWHDYLAKRLRETLSDVTEEDILRATKLYEIWCLETSKGVTPRNINTLVNELGILRLQWSNTIPLSTLAYYAINRQGLESDFERYLSQSDPYVARFDEHWAEGIAAIRYGVPPDRVLQVLLLPKISASLSTFDKDLFVNLSKAVGFQPVLQRAIEKHLEEGVPSLEYGAGVAAMMDAAALVENPRVIEIEKALRKTFSSSIDWKQISPLTARGVDTLISRCPENDRKEFAFKVQTSLAQTDKSFSFDDQNAAGWHQCAVSVLTAVPGPRPEADTIVVPGDASFFLKVIDRVALDSPLLRYFRPGPDKSVVIGQIASDATLALFKTGPELRIQKLTRIPIKWDWALFIEATGTFLEGTSKSEPGISSALESLGILRVLSSSKILNERLKVLSEGVFLDMLYAAHSEGRHETEARLISLLILTNPTLQNTTAIGNSEAGRQLAASLTTTLNDRSNVYELIDHALLRYGTFAEFVNSAGANGQIAAALKTIFPKRIKDGRLGSLRLDDVIARLSTYVSYLNDTDRAQFIDLLATYRTFWDKLESGELTDNKCKILSRYIETDSGDSERSRNLVIATARKFDEAGWTSLLGTGAEPLPTILQAATFETQGIRFGEPLLQALQGSFETALVNGGSSASALGGWFRLAKALDENRYKILLKDIKDRIVSGNQNGGALPLLSAGGAELLTAGDFKSRSDDAVRHVVLPLIERLKESLDWFKQNGSEVGAWISRSDKTTKEYLKERVAALCESEGGDEVQEVARAIGISTPKRRKDGDGTKDETKDEEGVSS